MPILGLVSDQALLVDIWRGTYAVCVRCDGLVALLLVDTLNETWLLGIEKWGGHASQEDSGGGGRDSSLSALPIAAQCRHTSNMAKHGACLKEGEGLFCRWVCVCNPTEARTRSESEPVSRRAASRFCDGRMMGG